MPVSAVPAVRCSKGEGLGEVPSSKLRNLPMIRTGTKLGMDPRGAVVPDLLSREVDTLRDTLASW